MTIGHNSAVLREILRVSVIFLIVAALLGSVWGFDALTDTVEQNTHPKKYSEYVSKYSKEYGIPEHIIYAVIKVESDFDPKARSSAGAMGLMQMMPKTFKWLSGSEHLNEHHLTSASLFDPEVSIRYGVYYLSYLYKSFDMNINTTLAAYNAGEGNVREWLSDPRYSDMAGNLTYIPFKETRNYVEKVNKQANIYIELYYTESEAKNK